MFRKIRKERQPRFKQSESKVPVQLPDHARLLYKAVIDLVDRRIALDQRIVALEQQLLSFIPVKGKKAKYASPKKKS